MSSTSRGAERQRDDWYQTPKREIDLVLDHLGIGLDKFDLFIEPASGNGAIVRELLARGVPSEKILAIEVDEERATACRALGVRTECANALTLATMPIDTKDKRVLCITNPPFSFALEFCNFGKEIRRASSNGSISIMLLRLAFLASKARREFWKSNPAHVQVLSSRPSFMVSKRDLFHCEPCKIRLGVTGSWTAAQDPIPKISGWPKSHCPLCGADGAYVGVRKSSTDSADYAWFVWTGWLTGQRGTWEVL